MLGLSYKGMPVRLPPGWSIQWEVDADLLDFGQMGQAMSWPVRLVRDGSEGIFAFAGDVDASDNGFGTYDDFAITVDGEVWWSCSFELLDADEDYYNGELTTVSAAVFANKDRLIRELVTGSVPLVDGAFVSSITPFNTAAVSTVRFPVMSFWKQGPLNQNYDSLGPTTFRSPSQLINTEYSSTGPRQTAVFVPAFHWLDVIKNCLAALGVTLVDEVTDAAKTHATRLLLHSNRTVDAYYDINLLTYKFDRVGNALVLADYMPELTLADLLRDFAYYACAKVLIKEGNEVVLTSLARVIDQPQRQVVERYDPNVLVRRNDVSSLGVQYNVDYVKALPEAELYRGDFATYADFLAMSSPAAGEYGFVKELARYYYWKLVKGTLEARFLTLPYISEDGAYTFAPVVQPVWKDRRTYVIHDNTTVVGASGFSRIEGADGEIGGTVNFLETGEDEADWDPFSVRGEITAIGGGYIDTDIPFSGTVTMKRVARRRRKWGQLLLSIRKAQVNTELLRFGYNVLRGKEKLKERQPKPQYESEQVDVGTVVVGYVKPMLHAVIDQEVDQPELGLINRSYKGHVSLWHGMVAGYDAVDYASAWADPYDLNGDVISDSSLLSVGPDTIWSTVWARVDTWLRQTRRMEVAVHLSDEEVKQLVAYHKAAGLNWELLLARYSCTISEDGLVNQVIEGWKV